MDHIIDKGSSFDEKEGRSNECEEIDVASPLVPFQRSTTLQRQERDSLIQHWAMTGSLKYVVGPESLLSQELLCEEEEQKQQQGCLQECLKSEIDKNSDDANGSFSAYEPPYDGNFSLEQQEHHDLRVQQHQTGVFHNPSDREMFSQPIPCNETSISRLDLTFFSYVLTPEDAVNADLPPFHTTIPLSYADFDVMPRKDHVCKEWSDDLPPTEDMENPRDECSTKHDQNMLPTCDRSKIAFVKLFEVSPSSRTSIRGKRSRSQRLNHDSNEQVKSSFIAHNLLAHTDLTVQQSPFQQPLLPRTHATASKASPIVASATSISFNEWKRGLQEEIKVTGYSKLQVDDHIDIEASVHTSASSQCTRVNSALNLRPSTNKRKTIRSIEYLQAQQAAHLARQVLTSKKTAKQLLLSMAIKRINPLDKDGDQWFHPTSGTVIYDGFLWADFRPLEKLLRQHMEEYYELSIMKCQTRLQQDFNNQLVTLIRREAAKHGWTFDNNSFDDKKIRNRIRCYFKTLIQNARKRLKTMLRTPTKKANAKALVEHMTLIEKINEIRETRIADGHYVTFFEVVEQYAENNDSTSNSCDTDALCDEIIQQQLEHGQLENDSMNREVYLNARELGNSCGIHNSSDFQIAADHPMETNIFSSDVGGNYMGCAEQEDVFFRIKLDQYSEAAKRDQEQSCCGHDILGFCKSVDQAGESISQHESGRNSIERQSSECYNQTIPREDEDDRYSTAELLLYGLSKQSDRKKLDIIADL